VDFGWFEKSIADTTDPSQRCSHDRLGAGSDC
jgi:hypothetical protein